MKKTVGIFGLALRNLKRKFIRTLILLLAVTVVSGALFGATIFTSGMRNALKIGTYRLGADVLVVPEGHEVQAKTALLSGEPTTFYMSADILDKVKTVKGVKKASPQLFIKPTSFTCCYNVDVFLIAFDPETDFTIKPWLEKHLNRPLKFNEVITGRDIPVIVGDTIPFFGSAFDVAGTLEPTGMNYFDRGVFMTLEGAYRMAEASVKRAMIPLKLDRNKISAVLVQVEDDISPERVAIRIEHDVPGVKAIASDQVISTVRKQMKGLLHGIITISVIVWLIALLLIGFAFYMIVNERQREIGLLRAMGAKKLHIFRLIIFEASLISVFGGIIGIILSGVFLSAVKDLIKHNLKLPYLVPSTSVLISLVIMAIVFAELTGLIASVLPALSASRMEPYEAIRKGE
ncbi:MAG: FtsX-like permease family protein [Nitrospirae bacterium]|nr:FtsX-like permease family protein [Nitrospirota bacterium]